MTIRSWTDEEVLAEGEVFGLAKVRAMCREIVRLRGDLDKLGKTAERHGWNGVENSKILSVFIDNALTDAAGARGALARNQAYAKALMKYVSHTSCARNALGGAMVECTRGLDALLAGGQD